MGTLKERLAIDEELFCYDGKTQIERVKVVEVNKAAKTAKLSNQVICSRYPDSSGNFIKQGANSGSYQIRRWDEGTERFYQAFISRQRVRSFVTEIEVGILNRTSSIIESSPADLDMLIKINKYLSKVFDKKEDKK